ncbi:MAG: hypothetical protein QM790_20400 [Nibricoccus sp.]
MQYSLLAQLLARDPRKVVRFPDVPLDQALAALQRLHATVEELKAVPAPAEPYAPAIGSMPPVVPAAPAETAQPESTANEQAPSPANADLEGITGSLANLATQVWRARNRIIDPATGEPREEMRRLHRHIEGAMDTFGLMGVVINDWVNQPYDAGLPVKVLTFQPTPDVQRDVVLEAVRPTVIWKDRLLQMGEVIVGIPPSTEPPPQ